MTASVMDPPEALDDVDQVDAAEGLSVDPEAPYGRKPDGTPYKRHPEWRAKLASTLANARAAKAPQRTATRRTASKGTSTTKTASKAPSVDYRPGVKGLLQLPAFALGMLGRFVNPAYALDSAAITLHADAVAEAVHQTALEHDQVAAILDRALALGPAGALLGALIPLGLQLAANHGAIAANPEMGILPPDLLVEALAAGR